MVTADQPDDEPPTHPDTVSDCRRESDDMSGEPPDTVVEKVDWVRDVETLPTEPHPEDYKVDTRISVVEMDTHVHTLENLGYAVERIGFNPPYGCQFYCTIH